MKFSKEWFTKKYLNERTIYFSLGSLVLNFFMGFVKVILSAFIQSLNFGFNGVYNIILGFAKNSAIKEYNNAEKIEDRKEEERKRKKI